MQAPPIVGRPRSNCIPPRCMSNPDYILSKRKEETTWSSLPPEFLCGHCNELLIDPLLTKCCSGNVCTPCLSKWQHSENVKSNTERMCPLCSSVGFKFLDNHTLAQEMKEAVVSCKHSSLGCTWTGGVEQLSRHLQSADGCQYVSQPCPQGCGKQVRRGLLTDHLLTAGCLLVWKKCEHCSDLVPDESMEAHINTSCPSYPLTCPNQCGATVKRAQLPHHDRECPLSVVDCPFKEAGCSAVMERKEITHHHQQEHVGHLLSAFQYLHDELSSIKLQLHTTQENQQAMAKELQKTKKDLADANMEFQKQKTSVNLITSTLRTELGFFHPSCSCEAFALECAKTQLAIMTDRSKAFLRPNSPALTFRLTNYSKLKQSNRPWHSPPFYIREGYKMCIAVHLNGDQEGSGTHISVHIHLMAGEYDSKLKWPLAYNEEISVSLMQLHSSSTSSTKTKSLPIAKTLQLSNGKNSNSPTSSPGISRLAPPSPTRSSPVTTTKFKHHFSPHSHDSPPTHPHNNFSLTPVIQQTIRSLVFNLYCVQKPPGAVGLPFGTVGLFCRQDVIDSTVLCNNSLVFQISMDSSGD